MISFDNIIIQADLIDIIQDIRRDLAIKGLARFEVLRDNGDNIQTNCPFHKEGQERKPSFGIHKGNGDAHCFTCGWSGNLATMISEIFGFVDSGKFGKQWLLKKYNSVEIESRPNLMENFERRKKSGNHNILSGAVSNNIITDAGLDEYRYIHPYMYKRGLTNEIIEEFDIGYSSKDNRITFPIKDIRGGVVFVAGRSVNSKFFYLPQGKAKPIYQAYRFTSGRYKEAWIVESFFNCLTCWKYGIPAMALIGTGNKEQYKILERLPVRSYVLALDPDEAGRKATKRFRKNVKGKIIKEVVYNSKEDINDLDEKVLDLKIVF